MRYSRQERLPFIPSNFSNNIKDKKIILVGCGGIGSIVAELLVRGGFKDITLIDSDLVDESNLQRQIFVENDIGKLKTTALKKRLKDIDSKCSIDTFAEIINEKNIKQLCSKSNLIIETTDNFQTRKIINTYCQKENKDWLYSGAVKTEFVSCLFYGRDRLFNKVFSNNVNDESCCDVGVLASTTFACASLVYNETLKYFLDLKENNLVKIDLWNLEFYKIKIKKDN